MQKLDELLELVRGNTPNVVRKQAERRTGQCILDAKAELQDGKHGLDALPEFQQLVLRFGQDLFERAGRQRLIEEV